jgi:DNA replication initiation complex subunit (GINS family)
MGEDKINITYETLFELLRNEKNREDLQKLDRDFMKDIRSYIDQKKNSISNSIQNSEDDGTTWISVQRNIKSILKQLYDKRETKIVRMALNKARTNTNIIDTSVLLKEEKEMYEKLVSLFSEYRGQLLTSLFVGWKRMPEGRPGVEEPSEVSQDKGSVSDNQETTDEDEDEDMDDDMDDEPGKTKVVRFLSAVPKFMGKELEVYGPFDEEDVASLPEDVAELLIKKGRAEELTED